ncbi:flavodoxin reductase [Chitinophaga lutea]|uniref:Flavodoxin reductase n=1 Tax=Chitinophaga lutea TaxID=2488634 RepID=A0A3N4Q8M8_9BACT|nr:FAD-binding oxidoreductase [Chitinophaga lutea]RPE12397.1 flavodoxin reductase [Chitinophaga lutea]
MEEHIVSILDITPVTHNVKRFTVEKPAGYRFIPGQATDVAVNKPGWEQELRPFTFTALNEWDHLEFTIKIYDDHSGVTHQLGQLQAGDSLRIHDVWGAIQYRGEGTFIAGGAGVTPFIAIFRQLQHEGRVGLNKLIFSNKTREDIILEREFREILGGNFINTLTEEARPGYDHHRIDEVYLRSKIKDFRQPFYLCGPDAMVAGVKDILEKLGGETIVVEL